MPHHGWSHNIPSWRSDSPSMQFTLLCPATSSVTRSCGPPSAHVTTHHSLKRTPSGSRPSSSMPWSYVPAPFEVNRKVRPPILLTPPKKNTATYVSNFSSDLMTKINGGCKATLKLQFGVLSTEIGSCKRDGNLGWQSVIFFPFFKIILSFSFSSFGSWSCLNLHLVLNCFCVLCKQQSISGHTIFVEIIISYTEYVQTFRYGLILSLLLSDII
jgi:hypothetical protein